MPSGTEKPGRESGRNHSFPQTEAPAAPQPAAGPNLSAAFRAALGGVADQPHLRPDSARSARKPGKQAKEERPAAPLKAPPRKAHIGPRSGHK